MEKGFFGKLRLSICLLFYRAILNIGWCSKYDEDYSHDKWLRENDFYTMKSSTFMYDEEHDQKEFNVDLLMANQHNKCESKHYWNLLFGLRYSIFNILLMSTCFKLCTT